MILDSANRAAAGEGRQEGRPPPMTREQYQRQFYHNRQASESIGNKPNDGNASNHNNVDKRRLDSEEKRPEAKVPRYGTTNGQAHPNGNLGDLLMAINGFRMDIDCSPHSQAQALNHGETTSSAVAALSGASGKQSAFNQPLHLYSQRGTSDHVRYHAIRGAWSRTHKFDVKIFLI